jgi:nucleoside-diphosphate-sugar epimerase
MTAPWFAGGRPVLITGGRGFLGSHFALRLVATAPDGCEVVCLDNGTRDCFSSLGVEPPPQLRFVTGDVREPDAWLDDVGAPSVVIHCAALAGVSTYYKSPASVLQVNGLGTCRLLDALTARRPPDLFINLSTSEVYGRDAEGADESGPTPVGPVQDPRWTYAASKVFAEQMVLHHEGVTRKVSVRPFNVYGPGQVGEGAIRNFSEAAVRGEQLQVTGDGSQSRAWIYVDDFVDAVLTLAATETSWGRTYNVGNPSTLVATLALAEEINRLGGNEAGIRLVAHPGQDVRARWPRTERLEEATGWSARIGLTEGLTRTVAFWRERVAHG